MSSVKKRLQDFIRFKKMSVRSFERTCGLANGYVNNIRSGVSKDVCSKIAEHFPELNLTWLATGEGTMLEGTSLPLDELSLLAQGRYMELLELRDERIRFLENEILNLYNQIEKLQKRNLTNAR